MSVIAGLFLNKTTALLATLAILVGLLSLQTWRIGRLHNDLRHSAAATAAATQRAVDIDAARKKDAAQAKESYDAQQQFCAAGLRAAIHQGRTIERIVSAPAPAGGGRGLVGADSLRDLVGDPPPTPAPGVPH